MRSKGIYFVLPTTYKFGTRIFSTIAWTGSVDKIILVFIPILGGSFPRQFWFLGAQGLGTFGEIIPPLTLIDMLVLIFTVI